MKKIHWGALLAGIAIGAIAVAWKVSSLLSKKGMTAEDLTG